MEEAIGGYSADIDRAMLAVVDELDEDAIGEVPTDALLAVDASLGLVERRRLLTVARILPHLPSLRAAIVEGRASFDLAARVCRSCRRHRLGVAHLTALDVTLAQLLDDRCDADDLAELVEDHMVALCPDEAERLEAAPTDRVTLWPDLFGGGEVHVEATAETYALVTGAIDHVVARDGLLDRSERKPDEAGDDVAAVSNHGVRSGARGAALAAIARDTLAGTSTDGARRAPLPSVQVMVSLDALVGASEHPARLLTGGRMTASALRRLVEHDGADVTAIVTDRWPYHEHDGSSSRSTDHGHNVRGAGPRTLGEGHRDGAPVVVGVGRRQRVAPGWLDQLTRALMPRCVVPGCRTRATDLDHAVRRTDGGTTDLPNLARLCRRHHVEKDRDGM